MQASKGKSFALRPAAFEPEILANPMAKVNDIELPSDEAARGRPSRPAAGDKPCSGAE